jgi:hypothetical protein
MKALGSYEGRVWNFEVGTAPWYSDPRGYFSREHAPIAAWLELMGISHMITQGAPTAIKGHFHVMLWVFDLNDAILITTTWCE